MRGHNYKGVKSGIATRKHFGMFKDIAVLLAVDRPAGALIDYAASVAGLFEAHLDGIACVYQGLNPMIAP